MFAWVCGGETRSGQNATGSKITRHLGENAAVMAVLASALADSAVSLEWQPAACIEIPLPELKCT